MGKIFSSQNFLLYFIEHTFYNRITISWKGGIPVPSYSQFQKPVDVICQHTADASIIPLKVRIQDEDGELQIYAIRSYKVLSRPGSYHLPSGIPASAHNWYFECKILCFGTEKRIRLIYNSNDNLWKLDLSH